jgi:hypothetical protein
MALIDRDHFGSIRLEQPNMLVSSFAACNAVDGNA